MTRLMRSCISLSVTLVLLAFADPATAQNHASAQTRVVAQNRLIDAVKSGKSAAVRTAIQQKADVNAAEADGTTALHWAAQRNDAQIAQLLISAGAKPQVANRYGVTPLSLAAVNGNAAIIEMLLKAGADPKSTLPGGETVLM